MAHHPIPAAPPLGSTSLRRTASPSPTIPLTHEEKTAANKTAQFAMGFFAMAGFAVFALAIAGILPNMGSINAPTALLVGVASGTLTAAFLCLIALMYLRQDRDVVIRQEKLIPGPYIDRNRHLEAENRRLEAEVIRLRTELAALPEQRD